jgi:hypothetical protein
MWLYVLFGVAFVAVLWWFHRQNELFCVSVRHGKVLVVRGRIPQGLLNDFASAVGKVERGTIRASRDDGGAHLSVSGDIDDFVEQRLRNCLRLYPIARLTAPREREQRTLGQLLGLAWLAWLLDRR